MQKSDCSEKGEKSTCYEEIAAPRKQLFVEVVTLKKCEEVVSPKIKLS